MNDVPAPTGSFRAAEQTAWECSLICARWVAYDEIHKRYDPDLVCTCRPVPAPTDEVTTEAGEQDE